MKCHFYITKDGTQVLTQEQSLQKGRYTDEFGEDTSYETFISCDYYKTRADKRRQAQVKKNRNKKKIENNRQWREQKCSEDKKT